MYQGAFDPVWGTKTTRPVLWVTLPRAWLFQVTLSPITREVMVNPRRPATAALHGPGVQRPLARHDAAGVLEGEGSQLGRPLVELPLTEE